MLRTQEGAIRHHVSAMAVLVRIEEHFLVRGPRPELGRGDPLLLRLLQFLLFDAFSAKVVDFVTRLGDEVALVVGEVLDFVDVDDLVVRLWPLVENLSPLFFLLVLL